MKRTEILNTCMKWLHRSVTFLDSFCLRILFIWKCVWFKRKFEKMVFVVVRMHIIFGVANDLHTAFLIRKHFVIVCCLAVNCQLAEKPWAWKRSKSWLILYTIYVKQSIKIIKIEMFGYFPHRLTTDTARFETEKRKPVFSCEYLNIYIQLFA